MHLLLGLTALSDFAIHIWLILVFSCSLLVGGSVGKFCWFLMKCLRNYFHFKGNFYRLLFCSIGLIRWGGAYACCGLFHIVFSPGNPYHHLGLVVLINPQCHTQWDSLSSFCLMIFVLKISNKCCHNLETSIDRVASTIKMDFCKDVQCCILVKEALMSEILKAAH